MRTATALTAVLAGVLLLACAGGDGAPRPTGLVVGTVLAGPTCPVETEEMPCPPMPLADREVRALSPDGDVVARTSTDAGGRFTLQVPAGDYLLEVELQGIEIAKEAPLSLTVREGAVTTVQIDVDTGIR